MSILPLVLTCALVSNLKSALSSTWLNEKWKNLLIKVHLEAKRISHANCAHTHSRTHTPPLFPLTLKTNKQKLHFPRCLSVNSDGKILMPSQFRVFFSKHAPGVGRETQGHIHWHVAVSIWALTVHLQAHTHTNKKKIALTHLFNSSRTRDSSSPLISVQC